MKRNQIGVCIIGAGRAGMIHAVNYKTKVPQAKLVAMVDPSPAAEKACRELDVDKYYTDYAEALKDEAIDAVVVVTPTVYHREIVVAAAKAGKHIFCEKPMAMNEDECDQMIEAVKENKVKLQIGFMRRFDESFRQAKAVIANGEIGDLVLIKSTNRGPSHPQPWMFDLTKSNGCLAEVNSHDIDTLRWFSGNEFKTVHMIGGNYRNPEVKEEYPDYYDNFVLNATFQNGLLGTIDGAAAVKYGYDARVEILGTEGVIFLGQVHERKITVCNQKSGMVRPIVQSWRSLFREAYLAEAVHFINCILNDQQPDVTGIDGKMAVKVVAAGNRSLKEKREILLEY